MKFSIKLFVLFVSALHINGQRGCSVENRMRTNLCAEKLFFVGRLSRLYPKSERELDIWCRETTDLIKCVSQYTDNCREGVHRPTANVMLSTVKRNQRNYCLRPQKRQELLSIASCSNAIRDYTSECTDRFLMNLGRAAYAQRRNKVPHGCCSFFDLKTCILREADRHSGDDCSQNKRRQLERYIDTMAGNTLNLICGQYSESSNRCSLLPPLPTGSHIESATNIFSGFSRLLI